MVEHFEIKLRQQQSHYPLWVCYYNMKAVRFLFIQKNDGPFGSLDWYYMYVENCTITDT